MASRNYVLTPGAVDDIREIADWSSGYWGKERTVKYLAELHEGLEYIAANFKVFEKSEARSDLSGGTGLLLYPVNKHFIAFIPIGEQSIAVAAVIRQGRDIPAILQKDGFAIRRDLKEINDKIARGLITLPGSQ
ncbi:MAG: type II toxin-antitoxin system RelE/ParE family toxin [Pseudomonadota bacterium]